MNGQQTKNKTEFTDWRQFLKTSTDNLGDEMKCRMSRARYVSTCTLRSKKKREREPSRIAKKKFIEVFRKTR